MSSLSISNNLFFQARCATRGQIEDMRRMTAALRVTGLLSTCLDKGGRPCEGKTLQQATNLGTIEAAANSVKSRTENGSICHLVWIAGRHEKEYMNNHERLTTQTKE